MMKGSDGAVFQSYEDFEEKLIDFQRRMGTAYVKRNTHSITSMKKKKSVIIPKEYQHSWVQLTCIHSTR